MKICLTGATGFIGKNLLKKLQGNTSHDVIALSRKITPEVHNAKKGNVTWRRCNGFSLLDVEKATEGADILIYLIHSMLPATSLSQGSFSDFDLYLADNFARAAKKNNIKKIIYLSGLIPDEKKLSPHLKSRLEVEEVLSQYGNDLTVLRAGLIIGKNGSSFTILERLVKRLPILICPAWTLSKTQPIDLEDVLESILYCCRNSESLKRVYDLGGPDVVTYKDMIIQTARALGMKRLFFSVPFFSPYLSKLWVSRVTSSSKNLVYPLVESLKHEMTANPKRQLILSGHKYTKFYESLKNGVDGLNAGWMRMIIDYNSVVNLRWMENVTSIQRIDNVDNSDTEYFANLYFEWLPWIMKPFFLVEINKDIVEFKIFGLKSILTLKKSVDRSKDNRVFYYIVGGALARKPTLNGRLEFRYVSSSKSLVIALLDYRPALPWFIYKYTQALFHLFIMKKFTWYLQRKL